MSAHDNLSKKIEAEMKAFKADILKQSPNDIYNSWYRIGFYEEFYEMLMCDYTDDRLSYEIFDWIASHNKPLGHLYEIWLDCDGAFDHSWDAMIDWIQLIYDEREEMSA